MSNFLKIPGEKIDISTFDQFFMRQIQSGAEQIAIIHSSDGTQFEWNRLFKWIRRCLSKKFISSANHRILIIEVVMFNTMKIAKSAK